MKIRSLKTNRLDNPLGFDLGIPTLSWTVAESQSVCQAAARIEVFCGDEPVYDSGKRQDIDSLGFQLPIALQPRQRYTWQVSVWGDRGDYAKSETAWFETAKLAEDWAGGWITPDGEDLPILEKTLTLPADMTGARFYAAGLGLYRLFVNDVPASEERFTPGLNAYDSWVQYQTYDLGPLLRPGENRICFWLGGGIAKGRFSSFRADEAAYCPRYTCIGELRVRRGNGTELVWGTDDSWRWHPSPILDSSIYDGETWDPAHTGSWRPVVSYEPPVGPLRARLSPPVTVRQLRQPLALLRTPKGETVLDMGQNMSGWLRFRVRAPKGTRLTLQHGEILQDGCFFRENLRSAKAEFVYIADGNEAVVEPFFTWFGFRYVLLEGFPEPIDMADFTGCVVYTCLAETGEIVTSDPGLNRLFRNALWGQRGNFLDVPTDCPQRDEREGWTGDAQAFCDTACYNMDCYGFYTKYLADMWEEQQKQDGCVPFVVPNARHKLIPPGGAVGWADAATIIPWTVWLHYGDRTILQRQIGSMEAWTDWAASQTDWAGNTRHFGDWLALDHPEDTQRREGNTELRFLCLAFLFYSASLTAKAEAVLGRQTAQVRYLAIAEKAKQDFLTGFFDGQGRLSVETQTAHVIALYLGLTPDPAKTQAALCALLKRDGHLTTGFLGTPWLVHVLPPQEAWSLLLRREYPSWLYQVDLGATTIWERWNSVLPDGRLSDTTMNSLNHYAYGAVVAWMYAGLCGVRPVEEAPGFRRIVYAPLPDARLGWARCTLDAAVGRISCGWERTEDGFTLCLALPFGCEAQVKLPDGREENAKAGVHTYRIST